MKSLLDNNTIKLKHAANDLFAGAFAVIAAL